MTRERPNVFDEILSLLTPDRLLHDPQATGEGVTVCVIDSGVEAGLLQEKIRRQGQEICPIEGGLFIADRRNPCRTRDIRARHMARLSLTLFSLGPTRTSRTRPMFGPQGSCEVDLVIRALHWAINVWKSRSLTCRWA